MVVVWFSRAAWLATRAYAGVGPRALSDPPVAFDADRLVCVQMATLPSALELLEELRVASYDVAAKELDALKQFALAQVRVRVRVWVRVRSTHVHGE